MTLTLLLLLDMVLLVLHLQLLKADINIYINAIKTLYINIYNKATKPLNH